MGKITLFALIDRHTRFTCKTETKARQKRRKMKIQAKNISEFFTFWGAKLLRGQLFKSSAHCRCLNPAQNQFSALSIGLKLLPYFSSKNKQKLKEINTLRLRKIAEFSSLFLVSGAMLHQENIALLFCKNSSTVDENPDKLGILSSFKAAYLKLFLI